MMSSPVEEQIIWVKQQILDQVDAGMEHLEIMEDEEGKVLEFCKEVVNTVVGKIDVCHALDYYGHLQDTGELRPGKDRIACLIEYFIQCIELELATRYA